MEFQLLAEKRRQFEAEFDMQQQQNKQALEELARNIADLTSKSILYVEAQLSSKRSKWSHSSRVFQLSTCLPSSRAGNQIFNSSAAIRNQAVCQIDARIETQLGKKRLSD